MPLPENCAARSQTRRKTSCRRSSAVALSRTMRCRCRLSFEGGPMSLVEQLEGIGVATGDALQQGVVSRTQ